jgi:phosphoribosylaminoimidazole-succinocarboxamide synthase
LKFLTSGKVKDVYDLEDGNLQFKFSNRVSAYDVKFNDEIPKKGEVLCKFAEFWFNELDIPNHFVRRISDTEIIVKKMEMLPIECIVRGYFYGSLVERYNNNSIQLDNVNDISLAEKLPTPIFDPTTKAEHDVPITKIDAIKFGLVSEHEFDWLAKTSIQIYNIMSAKAKSTGFILADLKLEFGKHENELFLSDSIGPDEYRLWLKDDYSVGKIQEAYDKQLLRDWLTDNGFKKKFDDARASGKEPTPPSIPKELIKKMTDRYEKSYESIVNQKL